jgi:hypothetical protein
MRERVSVVEHRLHTCRENLTEHVTGDLLSAGWDTSIVSSHLLDKEWSPRYTVRTIVFYYGSYDRACFNLSLSLVVTRWNLLV